MPDLSTADAEIKVVNWLFEVGQSVRRGEPLLEVETDKATMEVECLVTGVLKEVRAAPDEEVAAGQVIAVLEVEPGTYIAEVKIAEEQPAPPQKHPAAKPQPILTTASPKKVGGMFARNRRAAGQRIVGRRMQQSKQTVPHFYLQTSANAEGMIARRNALPAKKIVWDAFFVHAVARALREFEGMCYTYSDDQLVPQQTDAVGVSVDLDGELYVVPVASPAGKTPEEISDEIRAMVRRLRDGDPEARRIRPANITVTNLGSANVESFTAIINPPESAILAVGRIAPQAAVDKGELIVQNRVSLTLSVDHRIVNGRYAADFLGRIVEELESL